MVFRASILSLAAWVFVIAVAASPLTATEPTWETMALQKACDARDFRACDDLAARHLYGAGVPKDPAKAGALFRKACDGGYAQGCARIEAWRIAELRPAACMSRDGVHVAYLLHWNERPWRATPGQRLLDGEIRAVGPDTVTFLSADGTTSVRRLFERAAPAASTFDAQYNGARVSVRMEEDVATFVAVMAGVSESNARS
jgi:TPR repeat protein